MRMCKTKKKKIIKRYFEFEHANVCMCEWVCEFYTLFTLKWTFGSWNAKQRYMNEDEEGENNETNLKEYKNKRIVTYK